MEQSKLFLQNVPPNFEVGGYIESNSDKNKRYFVYKKDNQWNCNCVAGLMKQECKHIKKMLIKTNEDKVCFYCGTTLWIAGVLDEHHIFRRSTHPELKNNKKYIALLCRKCHDRATNDRSFEVNLQKLWQIRNN